MADDSNNNESNEEKQEQQAVKFDRKKLYFFAGPHKCASTSIEKFFRKWAANGRMDGHRKFEALRYWRWPTFDDAEAEKEYSALVKRNDDVGYEKLALDAISQKFEDSDNGVFLGTEEFDQVGPDKYYDAMPIMQTIADKLERQPEDIKVVLNYRSPRMDQWISLWKHAEGQFEDSSYAFFLCQAHKRDNHKTVRQSMIGAEMNPLGAARVFLEKGWSVTIMDMGGVEKAGHHIAHAIGCEVLKGECNEDGTIKGLQSFLPQKNAIEKDFVGLNFQETKKAEKLFLHRDCAYKKMLEPYLKSGQLEILYQNALWADCTAPQSYYDQFIDNTDLMYYALLSQVKCVDDPEGVITMDKDMDAALEGGDEIAPPPSAFDSVEVSFFDAILMVALVIAIFQIVRQRMGGGGSRSGSSPWGDLYRQRMGHNDTEMTAYPRQVYRDDASNQDRNVGGFRDDVSLDEEEVSDQPISDLPSSLPRGSGGSVGSKSAGSLSLSGRI